MSRYHTAACPANGLAPLRVRPSCAEGKFVIRDEDRSRGIHFVAGSGSGKSLVIGGSIALWDFLRGTPQVLFDPHGQMIDAFLMRLAALPRPVRRSFWPRILHVDMSGRGERVVPLPFLHELGGETLQDVADRFLSTVQALDPHLQSASIQGWNALQRVGTQVGIILASLGLQLDSALDLLRRPEAWLDRIAEAVDRYPEAAPAAAFFREEYLPASPGKRAEISASYRTKVEQIQTDPTMRDMFCSSVPGLDWQDVMSRRLTVLLDFRGESNPLKRTFKTRAAYDNLLSFVRHRGPGAHLPLAVHIDELTELTNAQSLDHDLFARDLDYLLNVLMRNYSLWVTAAHQEMWQVSEKTQKTLLSMGTQIIGHTSDMESALRLAHHFVPLDPNRVKRRDRVWASDRAESLDPHQRSQKEFFVLDHRDVNSPLDEQLYVSARAFMGLRPFNYLARSKGSRHLVAVSAKHLVGNPWPTDHPVLLDDLRRRLAYATCEGPCDDVHTRPDESVNMRGDQSHDACKDDEQLDPLYWRS